MPQYNSEKDFIRKLFQKNAHKDFVFRALYPEQSPKLDNGDGSVSSHSMAYATGEGGKAYVFPTVVRSGEGLVRLEGQQAWQHAAKTGEFIEVDSKAKAAWLSKNYKKIWDKN
jgi:hypothetical protein